MIVNLWNILLRLYRDQIKEKPLEIIIKMQDLQEEALFYKSELLTQIINQVLLKYLIWPAMNNN